jgi:hypothetical protein
MNYHKSKPRNQYQASDQFVVRLQGRLTGPKKFQFGHLRRARIIGKHLWLKFQVGFDTVESKHLKWFLSNYTYGMPLAKRYRYYTTVFQIVQLRGKATTWLPKLKGPWLNGSDSDNALKMLSIPVPGKYVPK